jgi:hypothetical protein
MLGMNKAKHTNECGIEYFFFFSSFLDVPADNISSVTLVLVVVVRNPTRPLHVRLAGGCARIQTSG